MNGNKVSDLIEFVKVFGTIFLIIYFVGFFMGYDNALFLITISDNGVSSYAKVDSVKKFTKNLDRTYYSYCVDGVHYCNNSTNETKKVGDMIEIMYLPDSPSKSATKTEIEHNLSIPLCRLLMLFGIGK